MHGIPLSSVKRKCEIPTRILLALLAFQKPLRNDQKDFRYAESFELSLAFSDICKCLEILDVNSQISR